MNYHEIKKKYAKEISILCEERIEETSTIISELEIQKEEKKAEFVKKIIDTEVIFLSGKEDDTAQFEIRKLHENLKIELKEIENQIKEHEDNIELLGTISIQAKQ